MHAWKIGIFCYKKEFDGIVKLYWLLFIQGFTISIISDTCINKYKLV